MVLNPRRLPVQAMTPASGHRWCEFLDNLTGLLPAGTSGVVIDGPGEQTAVVADRLAAALRAAGRSCLRQAGAPPSAADPVAGTVVLADGPAWRAARDWDVVIWLRTGPPDRGRPGRETGASIVIDLHDPAWPVIWHVAAPLAGHGSWYIAETRAFFTARAATWDTKFGSDLPAYSAAIAQARIRPGSVVIDVGCGTGRALPVLRQAVGPHGSAGRTARCACASAGSSRTSRWPGP